MNKKTTTRVLWLAFNPLILLVLFPFWTPPTHAKIKVITTLTIIHDMTKNVAGDLADVECLTKYGAEIHNYEPTPQDLVKIQKADLILWNGLNLELWFSRFFKGKKSVPQVAVSEGVKPISIIQGPYHGLPNPHAWMSPDSAKIYVKNISQALIRQDPAHSKQYQLQADHYLAQLQEVTSDMKKAFAQVPTKQRWLATSEGAFTYLIEYVGFKEVYLWPINADQQGTPKQIQRTIDLIRKNHVSAIFSESTISDKPAKQVAKEAPTHYGGKLYVDSLTDKNGDVPTYLDLLKYNTKVIVNGILEGLKRK